MWRSTPYMIQTMENTVSMLTGLGPNCPRVVQLLVVICLAAFSQHGGAHPAIQTGISKREVAYNSAVNLISLEKERTLGGNEFTVRFTKNAQDVVFLVQDNMNTPRIPTVTEEANNVWAASFIAPVVPGVSLWFIMRDASALFMKAILLNNSDFTPGQQTIPELPVMHLDPPREAVYGPSEDVTLTLVVPRDTQTGTVIENVQKMFYGVDLTSMKMYQDLREEGAFTMGEPETFDDRLEVEITAHTSQHPMSGYLQLSTQVMNTGGPVAKQIQVSRSILVRPAGQSGPYPDGYLALLDGFSQEVSPRGNQLYQCSVGYECLLLCGSVGSAVSGMDVQQVKPDGSLEPVPSAEEGPHTSATSRHIYWKFRAEEDSGDSESITTFQCQATDVTHGKTVTKLVEVKAIIPPSIDPARSSVTQEDDPMDPDLTTVTFRCAVRGRPLPEVIFQGNSSQLFNLYGDSPDNVTSTGQNEAVATKVVTVETHALAQTVQNIRDGQETSPKCVIWPSYDGRIHTYRFYPTV